MGLCSDILPAEPAVAPSWTVSGASNSPVGELRSARTQTVPVAPSIPENMPLFCSVTVASVYREGGEGEGRRDLNSYTEREARERDGGI